MSYEYFNPNPLARRVGDCAIRAISAALDIDWDTAHDLASDASKWMGNMPSANEVIAAVLRKNGFYMSPLPPCPECYTVEDFARENPVGVFVLLLNGHVVCIRDGRILDTWDSGDEVARFVFYRFYEEDE